jgi:DNA replication protein DnaC
MGNSFNSNCSVCNGSGYVHPVKNNKIQFDKTILCKCVAGEILKQKRALILKSCEFPPNAEDMTFENFKVYPAIRTAYNTAKSIASNPNQLFWLTLMGTNGVGKTHLAVSICKLWVDAGIPARYVFVPMLLDELREGFRHDGDDSYYHKFHYYCTVPLLLMDDLGRESQTAWVQEKLETLIDYRLMHKLSLIITCNKSLDELSPVIASRLGRLKESQIININANDYTLSQYKKGK